jgi:hypothetical protein
MLAVKARGGGGIVPLFLSQLGRVNGQLHVPSRLIRGEGTAHIEYESWGSPKSDLNIFEMSDVFPLPGI